jgi:hypothetical protein
LIDGRIDVKVAGRLAIQLQTASKALWLIERSKPTTETRRHGEKKAWAEKRIEVHQVIEAAGDLVSPAPPRRETTVAQGVSPGKVAMTMSAVGATQGRETTVTTSADLSKHKVPRTYSAADENASSLYGARDVVPSWSKTRHRGTLKNLNRSRRKLRYAPTRSSPRAGPNHHRHLSSRGLSFSPHFSLGIWHNGSRSGVLWTLVERRCRYGIRFSIEGRNTS